MTQLDRQIVLMAPHPTLSGIDTMELPRPAPGFPHVNPEREETDAPVAWFAENRMRILRELRPLDTDELPTAN